MLQRAVRIASSVGGVAIVTCAARVIVPVNAATAGFGYLLLVLVIASAWGFAEALAASVAATLTFNYFFFPPIGAFTIYDPQNWVALLTFLATSVIASRLSAIAKARTHDAVARQEELEQLYALSRTILMTGNSSPFPDQLVKGLGDIFRLDAVGLYDPETEAYYRWDSGGVSVATDERLREVAMAGESIQYAGGECRITPIRTESKLIGSLALEGRVTDAIAQGIANLTAIGLQRAKAQDLEHQIEAARQSEQLRTALIDAMAHEFKTPLTSIKAATSSLLADVGQPESARLELLRIADEEAEHLRKLIDDAVDMGRLEAARYVMSPEVSDLSRAVHYAIESLAIENGHRIRVIADGAQPVTRVDRRLITLALRQLLDNAVKYSLPGSAIRVRIAHCDDTIKLDVTNRGVAIPVAEQRRIFERFYRGPEIKDQVPGSGLGLSIAQRIAQAHNGELTVMSRGGQTTFRLTLPVSTEEERDWAQAAF